MTATACETCGAPGGPAHLDEYGKPRHRLTDLTDRIFAVFHPDWNAVWDTITHRHRQEITAMPAADPSVRQCWRCDAPPLTDCRTRSGKPARSYHNGR